MNAILPASFKDFAIATGQSLTSEIVVDARGNRNWRAKLRQTLQRGAGERVEKGVWRRRVAA